MLPGGGVDESRLSLSGPSAWLAPKQALGLALALHELATNAAKHGALSQRDGRIKVTWGSPGAGSAGMGSPGTGSPGTGSPGDDDGMVELVWREAGGPPVHEPTRRGFGTRMLQRGLPAELGPGSAVLLDYAERGFAATIRFRPVNGPGEEN
jgi:two-component sensor histidine kinase